MKRTKRTAEQWRNVIGDQESSGMSVMQYCAQHGFSDAIFYTWRKRLRQGGHGRKGNGNFVEMISTKGTTGVSIRLNGQLRIELECGFDEETLRSVLKAIS